MNRRRILLLALAAQLLTLGEAHAQYAYITRSKVLVEQHATVAVLSANPLRAFVYCVIASPDKGEPLIGHRSFGQAQVRSGSFRIKRP
jgi:hypothetical protein